MQHREKSSNMKIYSRNRNVPELREVYKDILKCVKSFTCQVCSKTFDTSKGLDIHTAKMHANQNAFNCDVCREGFLEKSQLTEHMKIHHQPYNCDFCGKSYYSAWHLDRHRVIHRKRKTILQKRTFNKRMRKVKELYNSSSGYKITRVLEYRQTKQSYAGIVKRLPVLEALTKYVNIHSHEGKKHLKCSSCLKQYRRSDFYKNHITKCNVISSKESQQDGVNKQSGHDFKKKYFAARFPFACAVCNERFPSRYYCEKHFESHHTGKQLANSDLAQAHVFIRDKAVNDGEDRLNDRLTDNGKIMNDDLLKSFTCQLCKRKFGTYRGLRLHAKYLHSQPQLTRQIHTQNNSNACDICGKNLCSKWNVKRHKALHSVETVSDNKDQLMPFKCHLCNRTFATYMGRRNHQTQIHGERRLTKLRQIRNQSSTCDLCGKKYFSERHLKIHKVLHGDEKAIMQRKISNKRLRKMKELGNGSFRGSTITHELEHHQTRQSQTSTVKRLPLLETLTTENVQKQSSGNDNHLVKKIFPCRMCVQSFPSYYRFKNHMRSHANERVLTCQYCHKQFLTRRLLEKHITIHSHELKKHLKCNLCLKQYRRPDFYKNHVTKCNGISSEKCKQDGVNKSITKPIIKENHSDQVGSSMQNWQFCDEGQSQHMCFLCDRRFNSEQMLKRHLSLFHYGKKRNGRYFKNQFFVVGKPFACTVCSERFSTRYYCLKHFKSHHTGKQSPNSDLTQAHVFIRDKAVNDSEDCLNDRLTYDGKIMNNDDDNYTLKCSGSEIRNENGNKLIARCNSDGEITTVVEDVHSMTLHDEQVPSDSKVDDHTKSLDDNQVFIDSEVDDQTEGRDVKVDICTESLDGNQVFSEGNDHIMSLHDNQIFCEIDDHTMSLDNNQALSDIGVDDHTESLDVNQAFREVDEYTKSLDDNQVFSEVDDYTMSLDDNQALSDSGVDDHSMSLDATQIFSEDDHEERLDNHTMSLASNRVLSDGEGDEIVSYVETMRYSSDRVICNRGDYSVLRCSEKDQTAICKQAGILRNKSDIVVQNESERQEDSMYCIICKRICRSASELSAHTQMHAIAKQTELTKNYIVKAPSFSECDKVLLASHANGKKFFNCNHLSASDSVHKKHGASATRLENGSLQIQNYPVNGNYNEAVRLSNHGLDIETFDVENPSASESQHDIDFNLLLKKKRVTCVMCGEIFRNIFSYMPHTPCRISSMSSGKNARNAGDHRQIMSGNDCRTHEDNCRLGYAKKSQMEIESGVNVFKDNQIMDSNDNTSLGNLDVLSKNLVTRGDGDACNSRPSENSDGDLFQVLSESSDEDLPQECSGNKSNNTSKQTLSAFDISEDNKICRSFDDAKQVMVPSVHCNLKGRSRVNSHHSSRNTWLSKCSAQSEVLSRESALKYVDLYKNIGEEVYASSIEHIVIDNWMNNTVM